MDYVHKSLPKFQSESQALTVGPQQPVLYQNLELHPTKPMQDNMLANGERNHLQQMSVLYGSHLPMRYVIESSIMASHRRPGGYGSFMHGLNMHMGRYEELSFFDVLNDPYQSPELEREGIHSAMEKVYGVRS